MAAKKGKFAVLEGPEGVGKSSQCIALYQLLGWEFKVKMTYEPSRDTTSGIMARKYIDSGGTNQDVLLDMFLDDRAEHSKLIQEWQEEYDLVLCDRYELSTLVYQPKYKQQYVPGRFPKPDLTIVLLDEVPDILQRLEQRGSDMSGFDSATQVFNQYTEYFKLARSKTLDAGPISIVYGHNKKIEWVTKECEKLIRKVLA